MTNPLLRLSPDELTGALDRLLPADLLRAGDPARSSTLSTWRGPVSGDSPAGGLVLLDDAHTGMRCLLPWESLRACHAAALTLLAAGHLLAGRGPAVAVLGTGPAAQLQIEVIARHLSGVRHIAVQPLADPRGVVVEPAVVDRMDLAGIRLTVTSAPSEAVSTADLVVAAEPGATDALGGAELARGAVVVNAADRDLPAALVDSVDQLYVDDAALLRDHADRYFVRRHLARSRRLVRRGGWRRGRIDADLGQLVTGAHPGRRRRDHVLLVELLGAAEPGAEFAGALCRAAAGRGPGKRLRR